MYSPLGSVLLASLEGHKWDWRIYPIATHKIPGYFLDCQQLSSNICHSIPMLSPNLPPQLFFLPDSSSPPTCCISLQLSLLSSRWQPRQPLYFLYLPHSGDSSAWTQSIVLGGHHNESAQGCSGNACRTIGPFGWILKKDRCKLRKQRVWGHGTWWTQAI